MPFIGALGYDVFDPLEVVPEYTADIGTKKGEKVDYCILMEGKPIIIIECKHWQEKLNPHKTQLHRYFHVTSVRFGILTNGIDYHFFTDLEADNKMDDTPFLEFSLSKMTEAIANELKRFQKANFDTESIIGVAADLKYSKEMKEFLANELRNPSTEFVKFIASKVYPGRITSRVLEQFMGLAKKATKSMINEMINDRLQTALINQQTEEAKAPEEIEEVEKEVPKKRVDTTDEELQGFRIVQAILAEKFDISRIHHRDTKSYFGVLLDNNNRKPICRLHLNGGKKYIEVFEPEKESEKILIDTVMDIYKVKKQILATAGKYE